jgi:hypothetical protein
MGCMSTPATRPEPIEEDEAERRALEAAVAEARADPRSAPHAAVRAWLLRLAAGESDTPPPVSRTPSPRGSTPLSAAGSTTK